MHRRRSHRGQAITEMAVVSLLAATVLVVGIYFAESSYAAVKVHEAGAFAIWDRTATKGGNPLSQGRANARYGNFDSDQGGGGSSTQALARASGMNVQCGGGAGLGGFVPSPFGVLPNVAGSTCTAQGSLRPARWMPTDTEYGATRVRNPYVVCALGRNNGGCNGRLSILTDDWGLSLGGQEADVPGNNAYWSTTEAIWSANGGTQGNDSMSFAAKYAGAVPYNLPFEMRVNDTHTRTIPTGGSGSFLP